MIHSDILHVAKKDRRSPDMFFLWIRMHFVTRHFRALLKCNLPREEQSLLLRFYIRGKVIIPISNCLLGLAKEVWFLALFWLETPDTESLTLQLS